jgi:hypothetical protein
MTTPYRDDREALEQKLAALQAELERSRENLKNLGQEQKNAETLEREIAGLRGTLEDRARQGGLENVAIAAPCTADWNAMKGDDRVRFCGSCQKNVYNLSAMTRTDAERLVEKHDGPTPCVRLYKRKDGTVITNDCPVGRKRRRVRRIIAASIGGGLLAAGAMLARWRSSPCGMMTQGEMMRPVAVDTTPTMGSVAMPPPPMPSVVPSATPSSEFATPPPQGGHQHVGKVRAP